MSTDYFEDINGRDVLGGRANANGRVLFTRPRRSWAWPSRRPRSPRTGGKPGSGMIATATALLFLLGAGLLAVSLAAQYRYLQHERHQHVASIVEALALDVGMLIFSLLALGLARSGKPARAERLLIIVCAVGSALMNYAAANPGDIRSVAAYVMPPVFLAIVADRVISVVRRWVGDAEASAWTAAGRGAVVVLRAAGISALYLLRFLLATRSTLAGARRAVLLATPLPSAEEPKPIEPARADPPGLSGYCSGCGRYIMLSPFGGWHGADNLTDDDCVHSPTAARPVHGHDEDRDLGHRIPRAGTKTAAFLALVAERHGVLATVGLDRVSAIATDLAPEVGLHVGSARRELRMACLAAKAAAMDAAAR